MFGLDPDTPPRIRNKRKPYTLFINRLENSKESFRCFFIFVIHPLDKIRTICIMGADNLPRLGLESVDSFNCEHGEGVLY